MDNSTLNDKFKIASYIDEPRTTKSRPSMGSDVENERVEEAARWSTEHGIVIILPTKNINDLETQWIDFNSMPKHTRRVSDWKSIELFGTSNAERYYALRSKILNSNDIKNELENELNDIIYASDIPVTEAYIDHYLSEPYLDDDSVSYSTLEVEKARAWSNEADRVIIIPTRTLAELEALWDSFNMMHHKHCRESDWMSVELFGLTNLKHYEYLKRQFLNNESIKDDIDRYGSVVEYAVNPELSIKRYFSHTVKTDKRSVVEAVLESAIPRRGIYEDKIVSNVVSSVMDDIGELSEITPYMQNFYGDLPYFAPNDMIDMGVNCYIPTDNYYGVHADNTHINDTTTVREWFEIYRATYDGFYTEIGSLCTDWVNKLRYLTSGLKRIKESGDENAILARKQSILELGWNPEVEFTDKARKIARECTINRMISGISNTKVIDLCEFRAAEVENNAFNEAVSKSDLKPVYIVLSEGDTLFSKAIMKYTNSDYSHASIALDHTLSKLYSFTAATKPKNFRELQGGFSIIDIKDMNPKSNIGVFVFFVPKYIHAKISEMIENFKNNIMNTTYGYKNLFTLIFNTPYNNDLSMICSQFVDRCLKIAGIDITNRDSSLVSPEILNRSATREKYIYKLYHGLISKYNIKSIESVLNSLMRKAVPLKESIYFKDEINYLIGIRNSINDIDSLKEMQHMIGLVQNDSIRQFIERCIFDSIALHEYHIDSNTDNYAPSLDFIDKMICENMTLL